MNIDTTYTACTGCGGRINLKDADTYEVVNGHVFCAALCDDSEEGRLLFLEEEQLEGGSE